MKFNQEFARRYLEEAPMALAIERTLECTILSQKEFTAPVLDIGCGDGIFAGILFAERVDTGVDPQPKEIERARRRGTHDELITCYGDNIPKIDDSYQTIFSNSVLEHIRDLDRVLREANRLLAPGGRFYVTVPTQYFERYSFITRFLEGMGMRSAARRYRGLYNRFWKHRHCYGCDEWKAVFRRNGFSVVEFQEYGSKAVCTINDLLMVSALPAVAFKKIFDRWVLSRRLRKAYVPLLLPFARWVVRRLENDRPGGLVFFALTK